MTTVDALTPVARTMRTFGSFVLLGFLTLLLAPPILGLLTAVVSLGVALTSAFLPFAVLGLLVWLPYQLLTHGSEATWQRTRDLFRGVRESALAMPLRLCAGAVQRVCTVGSSVREFNRQALRFLGILLLEVLSGALVGLLIAFLAAPDNSLRPGPTFLLVGIGAAVGGLLTIARFRLPPAEESPSAS